MNSGEVGILHLDWTSNSDRNRFEFGLNSVEPLLYPVFTFTFNQSMHTAFGKYNIAVLVPNVQHDYFQTSEKVIHICSLFSISRSNTAKYLYKVIFFLTRDRKRVLEYGGSFLVNRKQDYEMDLI